MGLRSALLVLVAATLVGAGPASAAPPQELTVAASDGAALACGLVLPDGAPPEGGWPGVLLFHGLGQTHAPMETLAEAALAPAGYASLACDARGTGASGGSFGLDGPRETQDARELFAWLAARPDVSDTQIGALGLSLGGAAVWNAAAAGVPFKAIVPATSWTSLQAALAPAATPKSGLLGALVQAVPAARWDPQLAATRDALLAGGVTKDVAAALAARSSRAALRGLATPTLIVQGRHDFLFDLDQALDSYALLPGPKRMYLGDLGHPPSANPPAELPVVLGEVVSWFDRWLKAQPLSADFLSVVLAHDPWDGRTTSYPGSPPPTRTVSVTLPGRTTLGAAARVSRSVRLTGGPHETLGGGAGVTDGDGAANWPRLVASVAVAGSTTPITVGVARISKPSGVATIRLMDEAVRIPRGRKLVLTLGATAANGLWSQAAPADAAISLGRATLRLSLLRIPTR